MKLLVTSFSLFGAALTLQGCAEGIPTSQAYLSPTVQSGEAPATSLRTNVSSVHRNHNHDQSGQAARYVDITAFGAHHHSSSHTHQATLHGGRTPITTEAHVAYNGLRGFLGGKPVTMETIGRWAFKNGLTNNPIAYGQDLKAVGLFYAMQGAKVGWIAADKFDPQIVADIQRTARLGSANKVMAMVKTYGREGYAGFLVDAGLTQTFINTLKMEPHYGGLMHARTHGNLSFKAVPNRRYAEYGRPTAHHLNHLTVLDHTQRRPFMNDTFNWPQWPALDAAEADVATYFLSMVTLGSPHGNGN